ncbi:hypothetical protein EYF80_023209 [Liparis tanakae]|uniref:Uncharacterized protein n=1 Tax=Liparis tanakae TaxID=230148 RepID=A0A4Z2HNG3_9TELE|nr:hypothetical protein EYF80_023209 [Liparis tanakae]
MDNSPPSVNHKECPLFNPEAPDKLQAVWTSQAGRLQQDQKQIDQADVSGHNNERLLMLMRDKVTSLWLGKKSNHRKGQRVREVLFCCK